MNQAISRLTIRNHFIPDINWVDIPKLAVITGVNGAGKTQILQAIDHAAKIKSGKPVDYQVGSDLKISAAEYGYVPWQQNLGNLSNSRYSEFEGQFEQFVNQCKTGKINQRNNDQEKYIYSLVAQSLGVRPEQQAADFFLRPELRRAYQDAWVLSAANTQNAHIARLFVQYVVNYEELIVNSYNPKTGASITAEEIEKKLKDPPWKTINDLFAQYGFKYRINYPRNSKSIYMVEFVKVGAPGTRIQFSALSSGEQMIVTLILWSFNEELASLKKLLVLDEPDAHLHPEMAKMFKEIISETLVKNYGIQVILTTHSPTTLCWIEEENIFLMDPVSGLRKATKKEALSKLTAGLIYVQPAIKVVLVEDKDDERFYSDVYAELCHLGHVSKEPALQFRAVTVSKEDGGGRSVVVSACSEWRKFSRDTGLADVLYGLVDRDAEGTTGLPENVYCLSRYCHENYYADPLLVFVLLVESRVKDAAIEEIARKCGYALGDTLKVKTNNLRQAQVIVDDMVAIIAERCNLDASEFQERISIEYVNGISVNVPRVFHEHSGKDEVLKWFRTAFPTGAAKMNPYIFLPSMQRTLLVPNDLVNLFKLIVSSDVERTVTT